MSVAAVAQARAVKRRRAQVPLGLAIAGIYRLRRLRPDLPRPYKVPGYPVLPAVFVAAVMYLVGNALVSVVLFGLMIGAVLPTCTTQH